MKERISVPKIKDKIKGARWKLILAAIALLAAGVIFHPMITSRMAFNSLDIENTIKITYVKYAGEAFVSSIEEQKVLEDENKVRDFAEAISKGKMPYGINGEPGSRVVFFHMENGDRISAFIDGDNLGFNYGDLWVETGDLSDRFDIMENQDLVKIKDLTKE